jgi:O-antigen/teichoic acid export membrane protein
VGRRIISVSAAQVGATAVTSALGFVFWWAAARFFVPEIVGFSAAATSAMMLLGTLSVSGLGTMLIKELPSHPRQSGPLVLSSALLAGALAGMLGLALALVAPLFSEALRPLAANWGTALLFAAGVSLTAITILVDQAVLGLLRERLQVVRNTVFAASKLIALVGLGVWVIGGAQTSALALYGIYATWLAGNIISLVVVVLILEGRPSAAWRHRPDWSLLWSLRRNAAAHHMLNMAMLASGLLLPVVVAWLLSTTANAYFYTAWMIAGFVRTVPVTLSISLYAVSATDPRALAQKMRFSLALSFLAVIVANVILFAGADPILSVFGASYGAHGTWSLRIFGLAVLPFIIKGHYVAIHRIRGTVGKTVPLMVFGGILEVGGATLGAVLAGLEGLSVAWLIAVSVQVFFMAPTVFRVAAGSPALTPQASGRFGHERADHAEA